MKLTNTDAKLIKDKIFIYKVSILFSKLMRNIEIYRSGN